MSHATANEPRHLWSWRRSAVLILPLMLLAAGCASLGGKGGRAPTLVNPYEGVDWAAWGQYKANLHTHTTRSDGKLTPAATAELYRSKGYRILALTDHETVTYPWTNFGVNPQALGMVAIQGAELYTEAHLNSFFSDIVRIPMAGDALVAAGAKGGLIVLNHPNSFTAKDPPWFEALYRTYDHFIGLETFNGGEILVNGFPYWDIILDDLMPDRPVWGFANDDMHETSQAGFNWNVFVLPALTEAETRKAMETGRFYVCSTSGGLEPPGRHQRGHGHGAGRRCPVRALDRQRPRGPRRAECELPPVAGQGHLCAGGSREPVRRPRLHPAVCLAAWQAGSPPQCGISARQMGGGAGGDGEEAARATGRQLEGALPAGG